MASFQPTTFTLKDGRTCIVRSPRPDDAAACVEYVRGVLAESEFLLLQASEWSKTVDEERTWIQQCLDDPHSMAFLAECDGQVVAFSDIRGSQRLLARHTVGLGISVRKAFRGLGVGKAVMTCAIAWAKTQPELERLTLAVMAPNAPAIALYRQLGFVEEGFSQRAFKRGDGSYVDDINMVLWLKSAVPESDPTGSVRVQPILTTPRLVLRPYALADAAELQRRIGDRAIADTTAHIPYPYADGEAEKWISKQAAQFARGTTASFAITLREGGSLIGGIGLDVSRQNRHAELGYWIAVLFWGQGYCTEAATAVLRYGYTELNLGRIFAHHMVRNPASGRVMQKLGMRPEGILRQHIVKWDKAEDVAVYGLLRAEWEEVEANPNDQILMTKE